MGSLKSEVEARGGVSSGRGGVGVCAGSMLVNRSERRIMFDTSPSWELAA